MTSENITARPPRADAAQLDALQDALSHTVDAHAGYEIMTEKAEPEFRSVPLKFRELHHQHADRLAAATWAETLAAHDDVAEAAVLGVDDEKFGQRLEAFVVLRPGAAATPEELKQHVREHLANFKVPRAITVLDELPRGTTGKISRKELQDRAKNA